MQLSLVPSILWKLVCPKLVEFLLFKQDKVAWPMLKLQSVVPSILFILYNLVECLYMIFYSFPSIFFSGPTTNIFFLFHVAGPNPWQNHGQTVQSKFKVGHWSGRDHRHPPVGRPHRDLHDPDLPGNRHRLQPDAIEGAHREWAGRAVWREGRGCVEWPEDRSGDDR